jgi:IclR family acetate operon transcriptional repressor
LQVLDVVAEEPNSFTLSEVVESLAMEKSSVHRFVQTLVAAGLLELDVPTRRYHLAGKALWIGGGYLRYSPVYRAAYAELERLANETGAMSHLGVWESDAVLYLQTTRPLGYTLLFASVGGRRPVHSTALGKTMLAYRPAGDLERVFAKGCKRFTDNTITSIEEMRRHLERIRRRGFALDDEEGIRGLRCVAAPIRDSSEEVVAALSVSAPRAHLPDSKIFHCASMVQLAAMRVSFQLGYRPAHPRSELTPTPSGAKVVPARARLEP